MTHSILSILRHGLILGLAIPAAGCGSDAEVGRSTARLAEVEITQQSGTTTTLQRIELRADGERLREMQYFVNGTPNGGTTYTYGPAGIERNEHADKDGDRAQEQLSWTDSRLMRVRYEVTGVVAYERALSYDATRTSAVEEIASTLLWTGSPSETWLFRYEYDADGRVVKDLEIDGSETETNELRYDAAGRLERATHYKGTSHDETYSFRYTADGRIDEVTDSGNGRYSVTYDADDRISQIRAAGTDSVTTYRYTYADGSVFGLTHAPALPFSRHFDLLGQHHGDISMMHLRPSVIDDVPSATESSQAVCEGFEPDDTCDTCLATSCCSETKACFSGSPCYAFYECGVACNGDATCIGNCRTANSTGSAAYDAYISCAADSCAAACN